MNKFTRILETTGARTCDCCGASIRRGAFVYFTPNLTSALCRGCAK